ncbi:ABC transporter ATP-binding protein [Chitinophagaceae bacterium MMS25-I14]
MSGISIKIENLGKLYRLGEVGTGTISHDLNRWWAKMRGKEDPFAKIGEVNDRTSKGNSDYVWALHDVSFDVKQGEVLGIIGRNGAGKSTLLKLLSKVTQPTTGNVKINGRIASLLEVGTGFHPELTGRENIFLNGAILGMTKAEIKRKFDEIVDFAGVERYVDTPVKRYSSGMYVRLAFAVAAFLEPEILIVDEVLAVGDTEFQNKCLGRMKDVSNQDGRTVLFVSHNLPSLKAICDRGVLLRNGTLAGEGGINDIIDLYNNIHVQGIPLIENIRYFTHDVEIKHLEINKQEISDLVLESDVMEVKMQVKLNIATQFDVDIHLKKEDLIVASFGGFTCKEPKTLQPGTYDFSFRIQLPSIRSGKYKLDIYFTQPYARWWAVIDNAISVEVINDRAGGFINNPDLKWGSILLNGEMSYE